MKRTNFAVSLLLVLILAYAGLAVRCWYLQAVKGDHYNSASQKQRLKLNIQTPQRGAVLDRRGRVLAASSKFNTIFAEPRILSEPKDTANELAEQLQMPAHELCKTLYEAKNPGFARIIDNATPEQADKVRNIYGIGVLTEWKRNYPLGQLMCHTVGITEKDGTGLTGSELWYNSALSGKEGKSVFFADAAKRPFRLKQTQIVRDGCGLVLTIDSTIQQFVREELHAKYMEYKAESAVAIVAVPQTGEILAMVSLPDFDPNDRSCDPGNFRNRSITDTFEPGSIIKPIVAAIALDCGAISENTTIFCENGSYSGKGFGVIREYKGGFGNLRVRDIIVKSSNIGMAKIGQTLGNKRLYDGLKRFGFGELTGIDTPGEVAGMLRPTKQWTGYSTTRIPFGHEITVTPIQILRAWCMLANGGHAVKPYLMKAIVDPNGNLTELRNGQTSVGMVISREASKYIVTNACVGTVNEQDNGGTGWRAKIDRWQVFGKTGTANIALEDARGFSYMDYVSSFVGGAPAEDPRIIVLVSIRKPDRRLGKGYTGGAVASPVVGKIIQRTLTYLEDTGQY